ncbi:MAG: CHAT domain-containing protein, partial [Terriglobales bacterium]
IRALDRARDTATQFGDKLHLALCDLDQSDVCLELSLHEDALQLAHAAWGRFQALAMPYEQGKALANMAMAEQFLGHDSTALELLGRAEAAFAAAGSEFWVCMASLYRSGVLLQLGRCFEAVQLSERAREFFESRQARTKAVYAGILTARGRLAALDLAGAWEAAERAATALGRLHAPWLEGQVQMLQAQLAERGGDRPAALAAYAEAMRLAEATRGHINFDELRLAFLRDKSRLYEHYLELQLEATPPPAAEAVWRHIERAKARSLALVMAGGFGVIEQRMGEGSRVVQEIGRLREELNWYYRQLEPAQPDGAGIEPAARANTGVEAVLEAIQQRERQLLRAIRELPGDEYRILEQDAEVTLEKLRPHLVHATLVEYFHCAQGYVAVVADQERMEVVRLPGERAAVEAALRLLRFQVGQRAMESEHFRRHARAFQHATESHLRLMQRELLAPLAHLLRQEQVVIVPHGVLHALPFAAVPAGAAAQPLIDTHGVSVAPSAAVFLLCSQRPPSPHRGAVVVAAEPVAAAAEIGAVRRYHPQAMVLAGEAATVEAVRAAAGTARLLHVAAHGGFRAQDPYFSGLELTGGLLNVIDIYNLRLAADLVVLTGCGTALGNLTRGDELIGLARAFLYAGARTVISSHWDLDDRTTAEFMQCFYERWTPPRSPAQALRLATLELRRRYAHPFFWAPFQLLGSFN